jgi:hypothetical protein
MPIAAEKLLAAQMGFARIISVEIEPDDAIQNDLQGFILSHTAVPINFAIEVW